VAESRRYRKYVAQYYKNVTDDFCLAFRCVHICLLLQSVVCTVSRNLTIKRGQLIGIYSLPSSLIVEK